MGSTYNLQWQARDPGRAIKLDDHIYYLKIPQVKWVLNVDSDNVRYFAFMLRLWQVCTNNQVVWRVSIEDPHTGERHGFADLDRLFEFLEDQTRSSTCCTRLASRDDANSDAC